MTHLSKSIIFIGFKHVGKSAIGNALALRLAKPFIDLDEEIERVFEKEYQEKRSCRQIMVMHGKSYFRSLEKRVLTKILQAKPSVIALGGGTPMDCDNQELIKEYTVVHVLASRGVVFERIMVQGRPAFFSAEEPLIESFNRLWNEREAVYKKLASFSIDNNGLVVSGVEQVLQHLHLN